MVGGHDVWGVLMKKLLLAAGFLLGATSLPAVPPVAALGAAVAKTCVPHGASAMYMPPEGGLEAPHVELDPIDLGHGTHEAGATTLSATVIPVWFHVITNGPATDVLDLQLEKQVEVLNSAYAGTPGGAASPFGFVHAGTDRTDNPAWYGFAPGSDEERAAKTALRKGDATTLNVYVTKTSNGASWATFPWSYRWDPDYDGVVLGRGALPGGTSLAHNEGDVAVHEAGHWLGLYHTFQGYDFVEKDGGGCEGEGDYVADTPAEDFPAVTCEVLRDTCIAPGTDPVHNYMDYSVDACKDQFTVGQVERMKEQWTTYRAGSTKPGNGNK